MIDNIMIGQYVKGNSFIHTLDPRTKIIINFIYILSVLFIKKIWVYSFYLILILIFCIISNIRFNYLLKTIRNVVLFIVFTSIFNVFLIKEGEVIFKIGFLSVYSEGIRACILLSLRVLFLIIGSMFLTLTTSPTELTYGFESLMSPLKKIKVPVGEISLMISIAIRFVPTLLDEVDKIIKAQKSRGVDFETGSILNRIRNIVPILVPLFINSFRRADELAIAMESRCYSGSENRFKYRVLKFKKNDFISFVLFLIFIILVFYIGVF